MHRREFLRTTALCLEGLGCAGTSWGAQVSRVAAGPTKTSPAATGGIYVNQIGFLPDHPKAATVSARGSSFLVRSTKNNSVVFRSTLSIQPPDPASGDSVRFADFSSLKTPGEYRIELDTGATGVSFPNVKDAYDHALLITMRSFYGQRCDHGVDLGGGYRHPKCHMEAAYHSSSGRTGPCNISGGWHDAGDYGRYIVNSGITTGTLLWAWELYGASLQDFALRIPETGGKMPDFLAEIQWNLQWMLSLQDSDGGVWQKQSRDDFCSFIMREDEPGPNYVIGAGFAPHKSTCTTADLAAVMAIAARCYSSYAPPFSRQCLNASRAAWNWCQNHPDVLFKNPAGIHTAEFGDSDSRDEILWATVELWRTTGDAIYRDAFMARLPQPLSKVTVDVPSPTQVTSLGYWSYGLARREVSSAAIAAIQQATLKTAGKFVQQSREDGYGNSLALDDYDGTSNSVAANHSLLLLIANQFEPNDAYADCALNNLHYLLGRNCLGISWVTQLGSNPLLHPHHRPSVADHIVGPWPGLLSTGPNTDPISKASPRRAPMRMCIDDERAYSCNEPTINCNAPLVFVLAALHAQPSHA